MKALSLFSGIGGLDLAASWAGIETALFCEIEPYACEILKRRWPDVPIHNDVRTIDGRTCAVDVVHGGFPCQDLSVAGKQAGLSGERSGLWFEMLRVISECRPRYVVAENVRGAVNLALDTVCSGLGDEGYEVRPVVLPASAVGAPHQRERLFVLGVRQDVANAGRKLRQGAIVAGADAVEAGEQHADLAERSGSGSLWPTPQQRDYRSGDEPGSPRAVRKSEQGWSLNLNDAVKAQLWPTPLSQDAKHGSISPAQAGKNLLTNAVLEGALWPTPCSRGDTQGGPVGLAGGARSKQKLDDHVGVEMRKKLCSGQLSPLWVECLMGYPLGWTDVDCDEPEPWPGWPALMGEKLWRTPQATEGEHGGPNARDSAGGAHLSSQALTTSDQYPYEPPRTVVGCKNRAKRLKCLGNSVVPQQAYPIFRAIAEMEAMTP